MEELEDIAQSSEELETNRSPIELHLCKGKILVWNADDVKLLRETHHIVGALVGSLPRSPRQNAQLGLPLQLMPEEAAVLIEYDVARMVNVRIKNPSVDDVATFEETRQRSFREQQALWDAMSAKKKQDFDNIIALGRTTKKHRRAERARKKKREKASVSGESGGDESVRCTPDAGVMLDGDGENSKRKRMEDDVTMATVVDSDESSTTSLVSSEQLKDSSNKHDEDSTARTQTSLSCIGSCQSSLDDCERTSASNADKNNQRDSNSVKTHPLKDGQPETKALLETNSGVINHSPVTQSEQHSSTSCPQRVVPDTDPDAVIDRGDVEPSPNTNPEHKSDDVDVFKKPHDPQPCTGYLVHVVTASSATPKHEVAEWAYPRTQQEILKYRVFRDLWETGYYLTSGCKFGGDFLVYPGDPFLYHSYFIAVCVPHDKPLSPLELITYGRLGTNVKKTVILCSVDEEDEVVYTSLQWTGLS
ncbi:tRNA-splicing endonuclease subunit Sen34-like [Patiria miniata]|uniref:tRNA-splicing endonuclease subunit SEN34 n=1 Tax=Patiria miniata TaxID=46514 RepID=A0A913ZJE5_PATMI|nr:tRNA-splicing endonuclease subunit Sen34-like [Patiria miniata]